MLNSIATGCAAVSTGRAAVAPAALASTVSTASTAAVAVN